MVRVSTPPSALKLEGVMVALARLKPSRLITILLMVTAALFSGTTVSVAVPIVISGAGVDPDTAPDGTV